MLLINPLLCFMRLLAGNRLNAFNKIAQPRSSGGLVWALPPENRADFENKQHLPERLGGLGLLGGVICGQGFPRDRSPLPSDPEHGTF